MNIMQKVIVIIIFLLFSKLSFGQNISVKINDLKNDKGVCNVCLFNKSNGFPDVSKSAVSCTKVKINNKVAITTFKDLAKGNYAVVVYHDENNNDELDTNLIGMPKEGIGVSNNVMPKMSKPKFEEAKFTLTTDKSLPINIRY
jgi:uncharacterized protein (DUF2141 family)